MLVCQNYLCYVIVEAKDTMILISILLLPLAHGLPSVKQEVCTTNDGDPCIFPFVHKGTKHHECIQADVKAFCAIETGKNGEALRY